jgi:hypothetical protein
MSKQHLQRPVTAALAVAAACFSLGVLAADVKVTLSGDQEVPPVKTAAKGEGTITVGNDGAVSGTVTTTGMDGTAAHIHGGAAGKNGGVLVPMQKMGDGKWGFAPGAKMTEDQLKQYKAGDTYVNVHTAANPGGEIRGQLKPGM